MAHEAVLYEERDRIGFITMNRPEKRNALGREISSGLRGAFQKVLANSELRVVVLTGKGESFCAGADISDPETHATATAKNYVEGGPIWDYFPKLDIPVIAAVNGYCFGAGMELALCCDIILASDKAQFGLLHIRWGLYPAGGGAGRLAALVGKHQAMYHILMGERITAEQAFSMNVVSKVIPHEELQKATEEAATTISQWSPLVVRYAKESIYEAVEQPLQQLAQTDRYRNFSLYSTGDREEGHKAFVEKRDPSYKGK